MKLHWQKTNAKTWVTEERLNGVPDFTITQVSPLSDYRLKMRSSAKGYLFDSVREAKDYAESI